MEELRNTWKEHEHYKKLKYNYKNNSAKPSSMEKSSTNRVKTNIEGPKAVSDQDESRL
ncbi:MAG: hypothetical protein ACLVI9_07900 [Anaerostipes hadrus]